MNRSLAELAARQYSVFTAAQAVECGLARSTLHHQVGAGLLAVLHPGVYGFTSSPASWERSLMGALLGAGPEAVVSHRAAARVWDIVDTEQIEITVPRSRCPRLKGVTLHRSGDLAPNHVSRWRRFPVTKPARTIVDLGAVLLPADVEDALDRALTRRLITVAGVEWALTNLSRPGRHGTGVVSRILDERALGRQPAHGQLEPRMARLLKRAGLPPAQFQYRIHDPDGRFLAQVDFALPEFHLVIEVDGWEVHGTPGAMSRDFVRQNGLVPYGWRVLRFTWHQVVRQPEYVAATIGQTLSALAA
ncbi:MAG: type IV toxin-antitoxin system AbiEi family antitoxin domain-containing protein [Acidimicrobiia bacterium]